MELTSEQKERVSAWVKEGLTLSDIQKRMDTELGIKATYMDVRFLVIDLGVQVKDRAVPVPAATDLSKAASAKDSQPASGVKVDLDRVVKPGCIVSGTVTFSDGVSGSWMLDEVGRLGLQTSKKNYKPTANDMREFQEAIRSLLERQGF